MQFHYLTFDDAPPVLYADYVYGALYLGDANGVAEGIPLRPVWPGFIINTLFYAGVWFVLIFGWRAHVRVVRRWQGYCPQCKYDLRGEMDAGCSECGWGRAS